MPLLKGEHAATSNTNIKLRMVSSLRALTLPAHQPTVNGR
jgi:hypothetical protein